jgi:glycosyltransferase involved in cell wall biosynthesis
MKQKGKLFKPGILKDLMKKEIAFLIPSMAGGGAQKVTLLLANELCKRGWDISLLIANAEGVYLKRLDKNIKIISLGKRNISGNVFEIARYLKRSRPALFFSSMTYVNVIAGISVILSNYKGKIFFSEHSNPSTRNANNKNLINKIITFLAKMVYKKADAVICVSQGVKDELNRVINNLKTSVVINNPIENFFKKGKYNHDKLRIISMGRLDKEKNFSLLIEAFSIVLNRVPFYQQNAELYILGEGPERDNLVLLISALKLQDKIFLPGFVENPEDLLSSADLFALCSNREGFPNVLVEALSCGLPVISTDCPSGPSEILQEGKFGKLIPVNDKESLANAIIETINTPNVNSTMEERMRRANDFSVESIVDQYESLFKDILEADHVGKKLQHVN